MRLQRWEDRIAWDDESDSDDDDGDGDDAAAAASLLDDVRAVRDARIAKAGEDATEFGFLSVNMTQWKPFAKHLGVLGDRLPFMAIADLAKGRVFHFHDDDGDDSNDEPLTVANMDAFLSRYDSGDVVKWRRSAPEPETNEGSVLHVTARRFDDVVLGSGSDGRDVLVNFYLPHSHCRHSKAFAPVYEATANVLRDIPSLLVADVDFENNEMDKRFNIEEGPTIALFRADAKTELPLIYNGPPTRKAVVTWLAENAAVAFDVPVLEEDEQQREREHARQHARRQVLQDAIARSMEWTPLP